MGLRDTGGKEELTALDAYVKLIRAAESVSARASQHLLEPGLTPTQFGALEALFHLGPLCQRALGEKLLKSSGNIVMVVDNLEKRGLVERRRGGGDRRFVSVHLTEKGRELTGQVFPRHVAAIVKEMSTLSAAEQEELGRLCRCLGRKEKT